MSMISLSAFALLGAYLLLSLIGFLRRRRSVDHIRGPPTKSFLVGHEYDLNRQSEVGDLEFKWLREYGPTWKISGLLGSRGLMTADPKALQHIFQKESGKYAKKASQNHILWLMGGPGIVWSQGDAHARHRKIMSPAFSIAHLQSFLPLFQRISNKLIEKWKAELFNKSEIRTCVDAWLSRATLDVIGEAAFDYDHRALDDADQGVLAKEYHGIFKHSEYMLPKTTLFFRGTWDYLPLPIIKLFRYIPIAPFTHLRRLNSVFAAYGKDILREKRPGFDVHDSTRSKDILSILIKANASSDEKSRLNDEELLAEMFTLTLAGHESTAVALTFLLYELARRPDYQERVRKDIRSARARANARGDSEFTIEDLDNIPSLTNAIKESLRMHPGAALLPRMATEDDVIPLAFPIVSTTGDVITEIPVRKGCTVIASFATYQRLPEIWGAEADVWNPDRFARADVEKPTNIGVYANLMTFSGGTNACLGWRFSVIEQQAFAAELIDTFQFSLPVGTSAENTEMVRAPSGTGMVPLIRGKPELGVGLRLRISVAPQ